MAFGGVSCPQGARASASDLRPSRTRATRAHSLRRLTRRSCREQSAAPSERWRTDREGEARPGTRRRAHAVPADASSSSSRSARVQAPRPLRMALLSCHPPAERLQVSRPQLSVTPATAARRSGGRGSSPTSRGRAELVAVDCSTRVVRVPCDTSLYSELGAERARGWPSLVVSPACCFTRNIITCLPPHTAPAVRRRRAPPLAAAQNAHAHLGPELRDGDSQAFTGLTFHTHRLAPRGSCQLLSFREIHGYNLDRHASDKGTYKASSSHSSTVGGASWGQVTIYIYRG